MAILVDKDVALGAPQHVYMRIHPYFTPMNGGVWKIDTFVDFSKSARELTILKEFVQWRFSNSSAPMRYDQAIQERLNIAKDAWDDVTQRGPWTEPEELEHIVRNFVNIPITTIQSYSQFFYVRESPIGIPDFAGSDAFTEIYNGIKNPDSPLFAAIESPQLSKNETIDTVEDDLESAHDMIARAMAADPVLAKLAPDEGQMPTLPDWNESLWRTI